MSSFFRFGVLLIASLFFTFGPTYSSFISNPSDNSNIVAGDSTFISDATFSGDLTLGATRTLTVNDSLIINENAGGGTFRVEGSTDANLIYMDAANNRIGIGTANPSTKLDVSGTANISGALSIGGFAMASGASPNYVLTSNGSGVGTWQANTATDTDWDLSSGDLTTNAAVTGNVGIGVPTPASKLDVAGDINTSGQMIAAVGSAAAPAQTYAGDTGTGTYRSTYGVTGRGIGVSAYGSGIFSVMTGSSNASNSPVRAFLGAATGNRLTSFVIDAPGTGAATVESEYYVSALSANEIGYAVRESGKTASVGGVYDGTNRGGLSYSTRDVSGQTYKGIGLYANGGVELLKAVTHPSVSTRHAYIDVFEGLQNHPNSDNNTYFTIHAPDDDASRGHLIIEGDIEIRGGSPGVSRVLTSNASGLATWQTIEAITGSGNTGAAPVTKWTDGVNSNIRPADLNDYVSIGTQNAGARLRIEHPGVATNAHIYLSDSLQGGNYDQIIDFGNIWYLGHDEDVTSGNTSGLFKIGNSTNFTDQSNFTFALSSAGRLGLGVEPSDHQLEAAFPGTQSSNIPIFSLSNANKTTGHVSMVFNKGGVDTFSLGLNGDTNDYDFQINNGATLDASPSFVIDRTTGNIGVANASPSTALDIVGTVTMTDLDVNGAADISGTATVGGFTMASGASSNYVLTSNGSGVGTWQAASLSGDGSSITNINASNIATGTLTDGRLTNNVALLNRSGQVFSQTNTFSQLLTVSSGLSSGGDITMGLGDRVGYSGNNGMTTISTGTSLDSGYKMRFNINANSSNSDPDFVWSSGEEGFAAGGTELMSLNEDGDLKLRSQSPASDEYACAGAAGSIRYNVSLAQMEFCDGTAWVDFGNKISEHYRRAFASSTTYTGNLGGIDGADAICQSLANKADLGGRWMAWLSSSKRSMNDFIARTANYKLLGSTPPIINATNLYSLASAINRDEDGNSIASSSAWTGTSASGSVDGTNTCSDWTSTSGSARVGSTAGTGSTWTYNATATCGNSYRIYCFEI